jgi:hypothetical protein
MNRIRGFLTVLGAALAFSAPAGALPPPTPDGHPLAKGKRVKMVGYWGTVVWELNVDGQPGGTITLRCYFPVRGPGRCQFG